MAMQTSCCMQFLGLSAKDPFGVQTSVVCVCAGPSIKSEGDTFTTALHDPYT